MADQQHTKIEIHDVLNPSEGRFEYIGEDTLVSRIGTSLFFFSLSTHKQHTLRFPAGYTLDAWTVSNQTTQGHGEQQIVVALSGADTRIHVYSWPRLHLEQSYLADTEVCYAHLALSRDGRYLVGVSSESHVQLRFWDLQSPDIAIQINDDPENQTNKLLRDREVRLTLQEECTFLSFNPFNHTQVVVGNERSVQVVTITAATSFQLATLTPQQVALDSGMTHRRVLAHTWLNDHQLLLSTKSGEILSVLMSTPPSIVQLRERELAASGAGAGGSGGAETPGPDHRSAGASTPGGNALSGTTGPGVGGANAAAIKLNLANTMSESDQLVVGLKKLNVPEHLQPNWKAGATSTASSASTGPAEIQALPVTVWTSDLPSAPMRTEEEEEAEAELQPEEEKDADAPVKVKAPTVVPQTGNAIALVLALTRHELVVGTQDGCLLWINKSTQQITHQQHIDVSSGGAGDAEQGVIHLAFSPSFATFVALTRRGHLRLFKPLSDRAAPTNTSESAPAFQTSSLGHFPIAGALEVPMLSSQATQSILPRSLHPQQKQPLRVGHVLIPTHPSDLSPGKFKLISYTQLGMMQLWCYGLRQLLGTYRFKSGITHVAVSPDGLLAIIGLESGVVNILDISNPSYMRLLFSQRCHSGPVLQIEFNKDGDLFATTGPQKIFFVRTADFKVLGYTKRVEWEQQPQQEKKEDAPTSAAAEQGKDASTGDKSKTVDSSDLPKPTFTSTLTKNSSTSLLSESEAQKLAERAIEEEKAKFDDEDETVATSSDDTDASKQNNDSILAITWSTPVDRERAPNDRLLVTTKRGKVHVLTTPNIYHDSSELKLDVKEFLQPVTTVLSQGEGSLLTIQANLGDRTLIYGTSEKDKMLYVYNLQYDSTLKFLKRLNDDLLATKGEDGQIEDIEDVGPDGLLHQKSQTTIVQSLTGNLLVTSGKDGLVVLRDGESLEYITRFPIHDYIVGGSVSLGISPDSSLLTTSGYDGSLIVFDLSTLAERISTRRTRKLKNLLSSIQLKVLESLNEVEELSGVSTEPSYIQLHYKTTSSGRQLKEYDLQQKILRDELQKSLYTFKLQFNEILQRNSSLPALERLTFQDFAIDLELKEFLVQEGEKRIASIREQIHSECIGKEYIIEKIKQQCWLAMETKGMKLNSFKFEPVLEAYNYPIRALPAKEIKQMRQIQFLRSMEIVEKRWRQAQSLKLDENDERGRDKNFNPSEVTKEAKEYFMNVEVENPEDSNTSGSSGSTGGKDKDSKSSSSSSKDASGKSKKESSTMAKPGGGLGSPTTTGGAPANSANDLPVENLGRFKCYHPLDVITPFRKRTQIYLLNLKIESLKKAFNEIFLEFYELKQREMEHIHEKAKRIQEIQNELQMDQPVYKPILTPDEIPQSVLTVDDSEIKSIKVLSKAERLAAESKAARDLANKESQDDGPTRALDVMMGGTLEHHSTLNTMEQELIPEEWMTQIPPEQMTEEQKIELAKFEKKVKFIQSEQETRRKLLQTELSKLKSDVSDIAKNFDQKFKVNLSDYRITVQRELYQYELMIIKLQNDMLIEEEKVREETLVKSKIHTLQESQALCKSLRIEFERTYRSSQNQYDSMLTELKALDRAFRKDLQNGGISQEQQQAYQQEQAALLQAHQARMEDIAEKLAQGQEVFDEDGNQITAVPNIPPPQPASNLFLSGAGENLESLYKLFRARKQSKGAKKTKQPKMQIDAITGRAVRAGSGLGRLGLLGALTGSAAATAAAGVESTELKRAGSRERDAAGTTGVGSSSTVAGSGAAALRKRTKKDGSGLGDEDHGVSDGTMNPYPQDLLAHLTHLYQTQPQAISPGPNTSLLEDIKYLDLDDRDKPESVDIDLWYSLLDRRQDYIEKEKDTRRYNYKLQEMALHLQHAHQMEEAVENELVALRNYLANLIEARQIFSLNTEVLLRIRQGQVEISESPVVTDLADCEMIDRVLVERLNRLIQKSGQEKVEILRDTTVSRTAINLLEWTRKKLSLEFADSVDLTTELQLLRVTKSLQSLIKMGGHDQQSALELKSLDRKIEFVSAANRDSLLGKKLKLMKVKKRIKQQNRENERLYETVQELEAAVKERMQISSIRDEGRLEESRAGAERMKSLVTRRKLVDLAKLQSEEIRFLREQVENLRRRTFASFAIPQLSPNPDERARTSYAQIRPSAGRSLSAIRPGQKMLPPPSAGGSMSSTGVLTSGQYVDSSRPHTTLPGIGRDSSSSRVGHGGHLPPVRSPGNGSAGTGGSSARDRAVTR